VLKEEVGVGLVSFKIDFVGQILVGTKARPFLSFGTL